MAYVVHTVCHFQDGAEDHARCFGSIKHAMAYINRNLNRSPDDHNTTHQLFELGEEIAIEKVCVEEPQASIVTQKYVLPKKKGAKK